MRTPRFRRHPVPRLTRFVLGIAALGVTAALASSQSSNRDESTPSQYWNWNQR